MWFLMTRKLRGCYMSMKADLKARKQLNEFQRNYQCNLPLGDSKTSKIYVSRVCPVSHEFLLSNHIQLLHFE